MRSATFGCRRRPGSAWRCPRAWGSGIRCRMTIRVRGNRLARVAGPDDPLEAGGPDAVRRRQEDARNDGLEAGAGHSPVCSPPMFALNEVSRHAWLRTRGSASSIRSDNRRMKNTPRAPMPVPSPATRLAKEPSQIRRVADASSESPDSKVRSSRQDRPAPRVCDSRPPLPDPFREAAWPVTVLDQSGRRQGISPRNGRPSGGCGCG